jgi:hypothetical protein
MSNTFRLVFGDVKFFLLTLEQFTCFTHEIPLTFTKEGIKIGGTCSDLSSLLIMRLPKSLFKEYECNVEKFNFGIDMEFIDVLTQMSKETAIIEFYCKENSSYGYLECQIREDLTIKSSHQNIELAGLPTIPDMPVDALVSVENYGNVFSSHFKDFYDKIKFRVKNDNVNINYCGGKNDIGTLFRKKKGYKILEHITGNIDIDKPLPEINVFHDSCQVDSDKDEIDFSVMIPTDKFRILGKLASQSLYTQIYLKKNYPVVFDYRFNSFLGPHLLYAVVPIMDETVVEKEFVMGHINDPSPSMEDSDDDAMEIEINI